MTNTEIYRAWHTLPQYFKEEVRRDYAKALEANELDPKNERIDAHIIFLEKYFGKHNLTASKEEKPRLSTIFSKGDKVIYVGCNKDWIGSRFVMDGDIFYNDYFRCFMTSSISNGDTHIGNVPLSDLKPYTEEQEPKEEIFGDTANVDSDWAGDERPFNKVLPEPYRIGDLVRFSHGDFCNLIGVITDYHEDVDEFSIRELVAQNSFELSVRSLKIGSILTDTEPARKGDSGRMPFVKQHHGLITVSTGDQEPRFVTDWLAYRMELAKEVVNGLLFTGKSPETIAEEAATIVDGIVERLKGGDK